MAHFDKVNLILDTLCRTPSYARACDVVGIHPRTIWRWMIDSKRGVEPRLANIEWHGMKGLTFHEAAAIAKKIYLGEFSQRALERADAGTLVPAISNGQYVFELDERWVGISDDEMKALGCTPRDRYKKDKDGKLIKVMVTVPPPTQLQIKVLEAYFEQFRQQSTLNVNVEHAIRELQRTGDEARVINAQPIAAPALTFDDDAKSGDPAKAAVTQVAMARPAKDDAELDQWNKSGAFKSDAVKIIDGKGVREVPPAIDPLLGSKTAVAEDASIPDELPQAVKDFMVKVQRKEATMPAALADLITRVRNKTMPMNQLVTDIMLKCMAGPSNPNAGALPARAQVAVAIDDPPEGLGTKPGIEEVAAEPAPSPEQLQSIIDARVAEVRTRVEAGQHVGAAERKIIECADDINGIGKRAYLLQLLGLSGRTKDHIGSGVVRDIDKAIRVDHASSPLPGRRRTT